MSPEPSLSAHPSTLRLHQLRLGELPASEVAAILAHVDGCPRCSSRHQHQLATEQEFRALPVPPALIEAPSAWGRLRAWWEGLGVARALVPVALVAAAGAFVLRGEPAVDADTGLTEVASDTRTKGALGPVLEAWVQTGSSARPIYTNESLAPGSRVQLRFNPGRHRYVTLAGRDGSGQVELYGTLVSRGPEIQNAPFSLTLDDTPGRQEFLAILTDQKPDPDELSAALSHSPVAVPSAEVATVVVAKKE